MKRCTVLTSALRIKKEAQLQRVVLLIYNRVSAAVSGAMVTPDNKA